MERFLKYSRRSLLFRILDTTKVYICVSQFSILN